MHQLTREILVACEAEARRKPSGFQGITLKQAGKRAALLRCDFSGNDDLKTLPRLGISPPFSKLLAPRSLKMSSMGAYQ
jgi:hypothetical protein